MFIGTVCRWMVWRPWCVISRRLHGSGKRKRQTVEVKSRSCESRATSAKHNMDEMRNLSAMSLCSIPGPSMLENICRYLIDGVRYQHVFIQDMFIRFGPIFRYSIPGTHIVYICDPDDIERVFRNEGYPPKRGEMFGETLFYRHKKGLNGGVISDDDDWHKQRSVIAPKLLLKNAFEPIIPSLVEVSDDTIANFKDGRNEDVNSHLVKWAAESAGVLIFGERMGLNSKSPKLEALDFVTAANAHFQAESNLVFGVPLHKLVRTPILRRLYDALEKQWEISRSIITRVQMRENCPLTRNSIVRRISREDNVPAEEVLQICSSMFAGGTHTTSASLLLAVDALSKHSDAQKKLYEKIKEDLPSDEPPTSENLVKMPYVRAFLKEMFRIYSTPPGIMRRLKEPLVIRGYKIPAETLLVLSSIAPDQMQRKKFGDNFLEFKPERWLRDVEHRERMHPFSSLPFGFGPRSCTGKRFVETEMSVFLIRLVQKFEVLPGDSDVEWHFNLIQVPSKPYAANLKARN